MKKSKNIIIAITLVIASVISYSFYDGYFEVSKNLDVFSSLFKEINQKYVDEPNPGKLIENAINGMLDNLDPYTNFISESDIEDVRFMTTGQYGGIGSLIQQRGDYVIISEPYEGFPACKAGLIPGDKILEVDGLSTKGKKTADISAILKGQPGTTIKLKIERDGLVINKELVREEIKIDNIPYYGLLKQNVAYIKLTGFTDNAGSEVKDALLKLKSQANLTGVILDLRGNGGGLLRESVNIANIFVKKGQEIVNTKGRLKEGTSTHATHENPVDLEIPLVILVDRGSASASEIVSGSMQDLDRAVIIGQRTYGKGLVQNVFPLTYNTQVKITIAKYYTPSGRCIQAIDYANRNEDGSVGKIPDSLITAFKTKNGRIVYDGGGIAPDISIEPEKMSEIAISLIMKNLIFDYATKFVKENKSIASADKFQITDDMYNSFVAYLSDKDYDYQTRSEQIIEDFKKTASEEKYFERVEKEFDQLKQKLAHNKNEDLMTFKKQIKSILKEEIISRYYYQKGRIITNLFEDPEVDKAIEVINNKSLYQSILDGTFKAK
ncbi:MAG: S41 family peptidase [Bacteroidota bacterium]